MSFQNPPQSEIDNLLSLARRIAVVGLSGNADRPAYRVSQFLIDRGYEIIPVNPKESEILGQKAYPNLSAIGGNIDIVDVFRRSDQTDPTIDEAIKVGAKAIWLQEGVINDVGALRAQAAGLLVVQDRCIKKELAKLED
jgi:predicted CoA-binding protein